MLTFILFHATLFYDNHVPKVVADELTPEIIDAAVSFVELASSTDKKKGKKVYYSEGHGISLTSERIRPVLTHRWLSDDVSTTCMFCYLNYQ